MKKKLFFFTILIATNTFTMDPYITKCDSLLIPRLLNNVPINADQRDFIKWEFQKKVAEARREALEDLPTVSPANQAYEPQKTVMKENYRKKIKEATEEALVELRDYLS